MINFGNPQLYYHGQVLNDAQLIQQQQQNMIQQQIGLNYCTYIDPNSTIAAFLGAEKSKSTSNLQWLDDRINEVRVRL